MGKLQEKLVIVLACVLMPPSKPQPSSFSLPTGTKSLKSPPYRQKAL